MAIYNPKNFALTAGAELGAEQGIPKLFGYYAENDAYDTIMVIPSPGPIPAGTGFFGLRTNGTGAPLTPEDAALPSATDEFSAGSMILIYGPHQTNTGAPTDDKYYILYVAVTSQPGFDTEYSQVYLFLEP